MLPLSILLQYYAFVPISFSFSLLYSTCYDLPRRMKGTYSQSTDVPCV